MRGFWETVTFLACIAVVLLTVVTVAVLTRPHAGRRGPVHWEAATILLAVVLGFAFLGAIAFFTREALGDPK